jgi:hypothetical protein
MRIFFIVASFLSSNRDSSMPQSSSSSQLSASGLAPITGAENYGFRDADTRLACRLVDLRSHSDRELLRFAPVNWWAGTLLLLLVAVALDLSRASDCPGETRQTPQRDYGFRGRIDWTTAATVAAKSRQLFAAYPCKR